VLVLIDVLVPENAIAVAGGVAVPSIQYWPPVTPVAVSEATTARFTLAVPKAIVVGVRVTLVSVGDRLVDDQRRVARRAPVARRVLSMDEDGVGALR